MDILSRRLWNIFSILFGMTLSGCFDPAGTITQFIDLETDTYISSVSDVDNSESPILSVVNTGVEENRILVKIPTGNRSAEENLSTCLVNPFCLVFFVPMVILRALISDQCADESFTAPNLNWAYLEFDTVDGTSPTGGVLQPELLAQSWWHDVTWARAHPFSKEGFWSSPGGSVEFGTNFEPNCTNLQGGQTCGPGDVKFEMTDYFKELLSNPNSLHYGLVIRSTSITEPEVRLHSVQGDFGQEPRIVANYNCISSASAETQVFYLNQSL